MSSVSAEVLFAAVILGLTSGISPGPLMSLVIAETLRHGFAGGLKIATAPLITDAPIIAFAIIILSKLKNVEPAVGVLSLVGGIYLFYLAYECFMSGKTSVHSLPEEKPKSLRKGVIANLSNPNPYLFWVAVGGQYIIKGWKESVFLPVAFIFLFLSLLVGIKVLLAYLVSRVRGLLKSAAYIYIMRILGVILAVYGIFFIIGGAKKLF